MPTVSAKFTGEWLATQARDRISPGSHLWLKQ
jgi:hypothetical protein